LEGLIPIRRFLDGQAFDPEMIAKMSAALEGFCEELRLKMIDDAATRLVAQKIIELVQRGVKDVHTLREMTMKQLKEE
jgi:hypothetical protein